MPIVVHKYGGSSVATPEKIKEVARKVVATRERGYDVVVVVSAMGNTTNDLMALARQITETPNSREMDMLVTVGERVSMALLSMAIHDLGHRAISFTGSQAGIITNDSAGAARVLEVRPYRVQDELTRGNIVIVAGYQGVSYKLEVTTLGRGGSDTTAVALAAALGAEACEIYSDVDGVYTADPRIVPLAARLDRIGYEEMQDLARFGAKVLNADAVEFARRAGIVLHAKATSGSPEGTTVRRPDGFPDFLLTEERASFVTGVTGRKNILVLEHRGEPERAYDAVGILKTLESFEILYSTVDVAKKTTTLVLPTENLRQPVRTLESLLATLGGTSSVAEELGMVAAVGSRSGYNVTAQRRLVDTLVGKGMEPILSFISRTTVAAVIAQSRVDEAVRAAHAEFLEEPAS